jgi:hypothetical protein
MLSLTMDHLREYLAGQKFPVQFQQETNQIYMLYTIGGREFPLFLRIFGDADLLQLLAFIPCHLQPNATNSLARLLHLLNKELDIPGFCMDETAKFVFYRVMLPGTNKQIYREVLLKFIRSIEEVIKNFAPVVALVASGASSYEEIEKKITVK